MKKIILLGAAAFAAHIASAQLIISPEAGFQMTKMNIKSDTATGKVGYKASYRIGANFGFGITKNVQIQAGAFFAAKGFKEDELGITFKTNVNYIEIPVYVNYVVGKPKGDRFFAGAGPYLAYCLGGKTKINGSLFGVPFDDEQTLSVGNDAKTDNIKPLDLGVNANIGFISELGIYARVNYSLGLMNISPKGNSSNSLKNTAFGISVGYQIEL